MARIELRSDRQALGARPSRSSRTDLAIERWRVRGDPRAVRLRQVDDPVHARRHLRAERRRHPVRRRACQRGRGARPQRRHRVPVLRALSAHDRARQHPVPAALQEGRRATRPSGGRRRSPSWCRSRSCSTAGRAQLSGGQQQRVALARALVKEPQLLLLDEPLSNLDASLRLIMRSEIRRLQRSLGVTTILVTHDQIEATTMADRVICMSKGRIEQIGTADDLYQRPDSLFVAELHRLAADQPPAGRSGRRARHASERPRCRARPRPPARSWSASGPSMWPWARAICRPRSPTWSRTVARRSTT